MNTQRILLLLLSNLLFISVKAEWQLALINDADGFTYVRSGKGTNFSNVATIKQYEFFYCEPASGDWWEVSAGNNVEGFVHKSRIKLVNDLPITAKKKLIFSIFKNQEQLADQYMAGKIEGRQTEEHNDDKYAPMLDIFVKYFCQTGDTAMLRQLFNTMWAYSGSADERPSFAVGEVFVCKPDLVSAVIKKLPLKQRRFIIDSVDWGLLNHFYLGDDEKPKDKQHIELKKKLDKIPTN